MVGAAARLAAAMRTSLRVKVWDMANNEAD
jgi:hypothetical protein